MIWDVFRLPKCTDMGVPYLTREEVEERIGVRPKYEAGWPQQISFEVRSDPDASMELYREDDIEEFLARPDIGRPDKIGFVCGNFEEDGPRIQMMNSDTDTSEWRRALKTARDDMEELVDRTIELAIRLTGPYYPAADRLTVALQFAFSGNRFDGLTSTYERGPRWGWKRSDVAEFEVADGFARTKRELEIANWTEQMAGLMLARWQAVRDADEVLARAMAAAAGTFSQGLPYRDSVSLKIWVGTPKMSVESAGMDRSRTVREWSNAGIRPRDFGTS